MRKPQQVPTSKALNTTDTTMTTTPDPDEHPPAFAQTHPPTHAPPFLLPYNTTMSHPQPNKVGGSNGVGGGKRCKNCLKNVMSPTYSSPKRMFFALFPMKRKK